VEGQAHQEPGLTEVRFFNIITSSNCCDTSKICLTAPLCFFSIPLSLFIIKGQIKGSECHAGETATKGLSVHNFGCGDVLPQFGVIISHQQRYRQQ